MQADFAGGRIAGYETAILHSLTLLGVTAYVAVAAAAFNDRLWQYIFVALWALILSAATIVATGRTSDQSVFARGVMLGCLLGSFLFTLHTNDVINLAGRLVRYITLDYYRDAIWYLVPMNVELLVGIIFGTLSLWRYRVLERREQQRKPD